MATSLRDLPLAELLRWLQRKLTIDRSMLPAGSVPIAAIDTSTGNLPTTVVTGAARGELGYAEVTANQTLIAAETSLTGLSVTFTLTEARKLKITGNGIFTRTVADGVTQLRIKEGATTYQTANIRNASTAGETCQAIAKETLAAGVHTLNLTLALGTGTGTVGLTAAATNPAFILVEDIGPA